MDSKTLTDILASRLDTDPATVDRLLGAMREVITNAALEGNQVAIPGFGSFEPRKKDERVAVHPSSGRRMLVPPRLTLGFKPSAALKQKIRNLTIES